MRTLGDAEAAPNAGFVENPNQRGIRSDSNCICRADPHAGQTRHARIGIDDKIHEVGLSRTDSGHPKIAIRFLIVKRFRGSSGCNAISYARLNSLIFR